MTYSVASGGAVAGAVYATLWVQLSRSASKDLHIWTLRQVTEGFIEEYEDTASIQ